METKREPIKDLTIGNFIGYILDKFPYICIDLDKDNNFVVDRKQTKQNLKRWKLLK
jgi:hypothetical protein